MLYGGWVPTGSPFPPGGTMNVARNRVPNRELPIGTKMLFRLL